MAKKVINMVRVTSVPFGVLPSFDGKVIPDDSVPILGFGFGDVLGGLGLGGSESGGTSGGSGNTGGGLGGVINAGLSAIPFGSLFSGIAQSFLGAIFQEGFSLSCIGAQAFKKADLDRELNLVKSKYENTDKNNLNQVREYLDFCGYQIGWGLKCIQNFRSSCSKALMGKYIKAMQATLDAVLPNYQTSLVQKSINHQVEGQFNYTNYTVTGIYQVPTNPNLPTNQQGNGNGGIIPPIYSGGSGPIVQPGTNNSGSPSIPTNPGSTGTPFNPNNYYDTTQGMMNSFGELPIIDQVLLQNYASENGISLQDILNGYFSGQVRIENGRVIWGVTAGNQKSNPMMDYIIYAGVGFLAYKLIKK